MSKKRKTRNEKVLADQRHVLYHFAPAAHSSSTSVEKKSVFQPHFVANTPQFTTYNYVIADIKKTAFITFSILTMQVILFVLMNKI